MYRMHDTIFDHNTAILGRVGSGKSYAARGIVEGWLENARAPIDEPDRIRVTAALDA